MVIEYLLLILGFIILLSSGDLLVRAGVSIAAHLKISPLVSGVTIVALGTSAPEFFVSIGAAIKGSPDIALGNVIGSNISNVALVLGVTAIILPLPVIKKTIQFDWFLMLLSSFLLLIFAWDGELVLWEGSIMVLLLLWYICHSVYHSRKDLKAKGVTPIIKYSWTVSILLVAFASVGLYFGAAILVDNAKIIAFDLGVSERIVGITIIALGTSLPELATSVIAACKKELDISVGNIIGSNIFNILGVLGVTSIFKKISVDSAILHFDIFYMIGLSFILYLLLMIQKKYLLQRWNGFFMMMLYLIYVSLVFIL